MCVSFGVVSSLLHGSSPSWRWVQEVILAWPDDDLDVLCEAASPYCAEHYARHPEPRRVALEWEAGGAASMRHEVLLTLATDVELVMDYDLIQAPVTLDGPLSWERLSVLVRYGYSDEALSPEIADWLTALKLPEAHEIKANEMEMTLVDGPEPWMGRVQHVRFRNISPTKLAMNLFGSDDPRPHLTTLDFSDRFDLEPELFELVFSHPSTANVTSVDVSNSYLSTECFEALIHAPHLTDVRHLDVRYNMSLPTESYHALRQQHWNHADIDQYYEKIWE